MANRSKTVRNTGSFQVRDGMLLLYRVGPANAQRQRHNAVARNLVTGEKEPERVPNDYRKTPFHRGYWAFPYPFHDAFFYYHNYTKQLPKLFKEPMNHDEPLLADARELNLKAIRKRTRPKFIWCASPFYSHIKPKRAVGDQTWYRYENARDWVEAARGELWTWISGGGELIKIPYARDYLEIFVPE